ncbi:MAG: DNA-binding response regulator [Desulforudis sp.]|nr:LytTR family DNA-binding domain-containing protein [Clostridia bacterium]MDQ7790719.1 LytTR family DNA-binding domain-containing protein [Clostridia bacterium]RJX19204.1 MAG: DNA-binding response regulator [Desulforudis sp.]
MKLKALIIDDEYPARQELRYALSKFDNVEIVGEAANASEALALIKALDYSVLFLDISMPGMNGLELGAAIQEMEKPPYVIFVTAYDEYALKAFEVNAIDYIMKPIEENRLRIAVNKVVKTTQDTGSRVQNGLDDEAARIKIDRIPADTNGKTVLVSLSDIVYAYTEQDAVYVKTFSDVLSTHFTLKELEARLDPGVFFRTHRCCLVNLRKVKEIIPFFNGTYTLVMDDTDRSEVPLSRAQAKKLRRILGF